MEDCKDYVCEFQSINVHHYREANGVAHRLTYIISVSFIDDLWLGEIPSIIEDIFFEDLCNCNRGKGPSSPSDYSHVIINK
jgi:hypothetical protein